MLPEIASHTPTGARGIAPTHANDRRRPLHHHTDTRLAIPTTQATVSDQSRLGLRRADDDRASSERAAPAIIWQGEEAHGVKPRASPRAGALRRNARGVIARFVRRRRGRSFGELHSSRPDSAMFDILVYELGLGCFGRPTRRLPALRDAASGSRIHTPRTRCKRCRALRPGRMGRPRLTHSRSTSRSLIRRSRSD
jgi:hypothetical protein